MLPLQVAGPAEPADTCSLTGTGSGSLSASPHSESSHGVSGSSQSAVSEPGTPTSPTDSDTSGQISISAVLAEEISTLTAAAQATQPSKMAATVVPHQDEQPALADRQSLHPPAPTSEPRVTPVPAQVRVPCHPKQFTWH